MLKGWFCGYCCAAISRSPSLTSFSFSISPFYLHLSPPFILLSLPFFFGVSSLSAGHTVSQGQSGQRRVLLPESHSSRSAVCWWLGAMKPSKKHIPRMSAPLFGLARTVQTHPQAQNFICLLNLWLRQIKIKIKNNVCMFKSRAGGVSLFLTGETGDKAPLCAGLRLTIEWGNTKGLARHVEPLCTLQQL